MAVRVHGHSNPTQNKICEYSTFFFIDESDERNTQRIPILEYCNVSKKRRGIDSKGTDLASRAGKERTSIAPKFRMLEWLVIR